MSTDTSQTWVLLLFHLPTRPTAARVRTWRRLQALGAAPVRNSGYALPASDAAREDFEWLAADIRAAGGEATVFAAQATTPAAESELRAAFVDARRQDFAALKRDAARIGTRGTARERRSLSDRLAHLDDIDFFGAGVGSAARAAVAAVLRKGTDATMPVTTDPVLNVAGYRNRTWVTRRRPGIDRFASAWLIRRFIDPKAAFVFADAPPPGSSKVIPFDMFGVEFGHQGGGCTFDTLIRRFELDLAPLRSLADLIRTVDLKLDASTSPDAAAVTRMVEGLRSLHEKDDVLLERGMEMIEALYRSAPGGAAAGPAKAPRRGSRGRHSRR